jgi:hypothetical protein
MVEAMSSVETVIKIAIRVWFQYLQPEPQAVSRGWR